MGGVLTLSRALAEGGVVVWEPADKPRLRVARAYADAIRREADEVREVLGRAVSFRQQLDRAADWPRIPLLVLPEAPPPRLGACISCGKAIPAGWRCGICLAAVYVALGAVPPLTGDVAGDQGAWLHRTAGEQ